MEPKNREQLLKNLKIKFKFKFYIEKSFFSWSLWTVAKKALELSTTILIIFMNNLILISRSLSFKFNFSWPSKLEIILAISLVENLILRQRSSAFSLCTKKSFSRIVSSSFFSNFGKLSSNDWLNWTKTLLKS